MCRLSENFQKLPGYYKASEIYADLLNLLLHTSDRVIGYNVTGFHCPPRAVSFHIGLIIRVFKKRMEVVLQVPQAGRDLENVVTVCLASNLLLYTSDIEVATLSLVLWCCIYSHRCVLLAG